MFIFVCTFSCFVTAQPPQPSFSSISNATNVTTHHTIIPSSVTAEANTVVCSNTGVSTVNSPTLKPPLGIQAAALFCQILPYGMVFKEAKEADAKGQYRTAIVTYAYTVLPNVFWGLYAYYSNDIYVAATTWGLASYATTLILWKYQHWLGLKWRNDGTTPDTGYRLFVPAANPLGNVNSV